MFAPASRCHCDLKAFFDTVNHDRLLTQLREKIGGGKLLRLIGRYLRAGVELLGLIVNRTKSKSAPLAECTFLGFQMSARGKVKWSEKSFLRFKQRVREITKRNRGQNTTFVIDELRRYVTGWMNYFGISHTYAAVLELDEWIRRRVRLYHWKQWKRPRTRRRNLIKLGINPKEVHRASRSRKGYWRMSQNSLVRFALNNRYLKEQGVPELRDIWIRLHYGDTPKPQAKAGSSP